MTATAQGQPPAPAARVTVCLGERSYPIFIGRGLFQRAPALLAEVLSRARFAIVADAAVERYAEGLAAGLRAQGVLLGAPYLVPSGEASKSFAELERICAALLDLGLERNDAVVAVGGGVIGDLAGFAAAILKRGVRLVQVPTTLLAQVDSAVGGKTGINTRHGKNLIGAFHQPSLVLSNLETLDSLPPREFRAGYAEVVKYGALGSAPFFAWLESHREPIFAREEDALTRAIKTSCEMKAEIVARDELEAGDRALLNLGHTFGHAIEAWAGYSGTVLHGEAVALGMVLAADFSARLSLCAAEVGRRLASHLGACGFATDFACLERQTGRSPSLKELLAFMEQDKKVKGGAMNLILLRELGAAFIAKDVPRSAIADFLKTKLEA